MPLPAIHCDLFCRVIDNFGDAGVCWRLARQLNEEIGWTVRLVIDRPEVLARLEPTLPVGALENECKGVRVIRWDSVKSFNREAQVVIEAFGCPLPEGYLREMRSAVVPPVWINLEYLSAEPWVETCHLLPSPEPESGLAKYFFFPGFTPKTGGLIREQRYPALRREFEAPERRAEFLRSIGVRVDTGRDLVVSVFCYPGSPLPALLNLSNPRSADLPTTRWLLAETSANSFPGIQAIAPGRIQTLPFLSQDDFDRLLLASDVNFVRGEDSFVRAQWAGRPFVWQAYRQAEGAHMDKLGAFLERYLGNADPALADATIRLWRAWNDGSSVCGPDWAEFLAARDRVGALNRGWIGELEKAGNLAEKLAGFCESKL